MAILAIQPVAFMGDNPFGAKIKRSICDKGAPIPDKPAFFVIRQENGVRDDPSRRRNGRRLNFSGTARIVPETSKKTSNHKQHHSRDNEMIFFKHVTESEIENRKP